MTPLTVCTSAEHWQRRKTHGGDGESSAGRSPSDYGRRGGGTYGLPCRWTYTLPAGTWRNWWPVPLVKALKQTRTAQRKERLKIGAEWQEWGLVFARPDGRPIEVHDDWEEWKAVCTAAGIRDARVHDARHTAATLLLEQGVDVRVVQEILGHATLAVTKLYTHVTSKLHRDAAAQMASVLYPTG
jgi:integrase